MANVVAPHDCDRKLCSAFPLLISLLYQLFAVLLAGNTRPNDAE